MATAKYTRGSDGYFTARVWDGTYDEYGKKHRKPIRSKKSSKDLERKVQEFEQSVRERRQIRKSDVTFLDYAREWRKVYKHRQETNTQDMYDNIIEKHLVILDGVRLQDIDRIHLQLTLNAADGKTRTQQQIYMTFKQILQSAVTDHLYPANVLTDIFDSIPPVKYKAPEKRPLTDYERKAVFNADFDEQDKIYVYIIYGCGLRRQEALALTIFDINIDTHSISITKAHKFVRGNPISKIPKTDNGYRTTPIPDVMFPPIRDYVQKLKSMNRTYLFTMQHGKNMGQPLSKSSYDKMWARILRKMNEVSEEPITDLTGHNFRHNYCTMLCYQIPKISIKRIAQLMGDTEKMVLEVYNHIVLEKENATEAVNAAINF